jgi:hypothetical protein
MLSGVSLDPCQKSSNPKHPDAKGFLKAAKTSNFIEFYEKPQRERPSTFNPESATNAFGKYPIARFWQKNRQKHRILSNFMKKPRERSPLKTTNSKPTNDLQRGRQLSPVETAGNRPQGHPGDGSFENS